MKRKFILLTILALLSFAFLMIACTINRSETLTESTTTILSGTISSVEKTPSNTGVSMKIYTNEYIPFLQITEKLYQSFVKNSEDDFFEGSPVTFRIPNTQNNQISNKEFLRVVSLDINDKCVYSLADYNVINKEELQIIQVVAIFLSILFALLSCYLHFKKDRRQFSVLTDN